MVRFSLPTHSPLVIALLAAIAIVGAFSMGPLRSATEPPAALEVVGPQNVPVWDGLVAPESWTPLGVLLAGAAAGGFEVVVEDHAMGPYVSGVDGHSSDASGGWVYVVTRGNEEMPADVGPDAFDVLDGDLVAWTWVTWST